MESENPRRSAISVTFSCAVCTSTMSAGFHALHGFLALAYWSIYTALSLSSAIQVHTELFVFTILIQNYLAIQF